MFQAREALRTLCDELSVAKRSRPNDAFTDLTGHLSDEAERASQRAHHARDSSRVACLHEVGSRTGARLPYKSRHRAQMASARHRAGCLAPSAPASRHPSPVQEQVVVALRQPLLLPLDDLLAITREFIHPAVSRSGLDRCLRRHGVSNLSALIPPPEGEAKPVKTFKDDAPGFVHIDVKDLPQRPEEAAHQSLFVAIDRASRWVYVRNPTRENRRQRPRLPAAPGRESRRSPSRRS